MGVYDRQIAMATRLITKKGQAVTWKQVVDGSPADVDKPWVPGTAVETEHAVRIVFLPDTRINKEFLRLLGATTVPTGNLIGLMPQTSFTPTLKDVVVRDGVKLGLRTCEPLAPNGEIIMYTLGFDL